MKAELERRRRELAERKTQLVETARPAMELLEKFARRELRLWTTMRGELAGLGATAIPALLIGIDDPDWEIRAFAASTIAVIPQADTAGPLMRAIGRETFVEAKRQMVMALANARSEAARSVLETATGDKDPGVRIAAVRGVGQLGASADALRKFVNDADLDVRYEALGAMAAQGDKAAITELVAQAEKLVEDRDRARQVSGELADNGDRYGQYLLGLALARAQDPRAQRIVREAVFREKPWEHKHFLRMGSADGLGREAALGQKLPSRILSGMTHAETEVRLACVRAVAGAASIEHVGALIRALGDSQLDVRHEAVVGLGRLPTPESAKALRKALSDRGDEVRLASVRTLGRMRTPEASAALIEASRDDKYMIRVLAVRELGWRHADPGVTASLLKASKDADFGVREQAMAALSHSTRPEEVMEALSRGLGDRDYGVRANACIALTRIPNSPAAIEPDIVRRVVALYLSDAPPKLAKAAKEYLDALRPPDSVDELIAALGSDSLDTRKRAGSMLLRVTETSQGYLADADKGDREAAIGRWKAWWAKTRKLPPREVARSKVVTTESGDTSLVETARDYKWKGLDIALLLDATGSMAGLIRASKERIDEIVAELSALLPSLRVSGYLYRDHGDDYLFYGSPLTYDTWKLSGFLQNATHGQGGDIPEAVFEVVTNATQALRWRPDAHKVVMFAGDAPYHPEQQVELFSQVKRWFTAKNQAQLHAVFTDTNRRTLDIKARKTREEGLGFKSPFFDKYRALAEAGRGRGALLDDESGLIRELLVIAFGEPWRADIEMILDFER